MISVPSGVRVWIATGHTDMRRGMNSLALLVQEALKCDPHLCIGVHYVAAPSRNAQLCGHRELCRHIMIRCFPTIATPSLWVGTGPVACPRHPPCPIQGASSRHVQRHIGAWWRPASAQPGLYG